MSVVPFQPQGCATRLRLDEIDHPLPNDDAVGRRGSFDRNIASLDVDENALGLAIKRRATPAASRRVDMDDVTGFGNHDIGIASTLSLPVPGLRMKSDGSAALPPRTPQGRKRQRSLLRTVMRVLGAKTRNSNAVARPPRQRPAPPESGSSP